MNHYMKGIAAASLFLSMSYTPAIAGDTQVVVSYSELNLAHQAGRDVLTARLTHAAHVVCGPAPSSLNDLNGVQHHKQCVTDVLRRALAKLPHAAVERMASVAKESRP
jgi:UrcA family protein